MKNNGKASEAAFEQQLRQRYGKNYFLKRLYDQADYVGRAKGVVAVAITQPADFVLVTPDLGMRYAEVKSTIHDRIPRSMFRPGQIAAARRVSLIRQQAYQIYIHHVPTNIWFVLGGMALTTKEKSWRLTDIPRW